MFRLPLLWFLLIGVALLFCLAVQTKAIKDLTTGYSDVKNSPLVVFPDPSPKDSTEESLLGFLVCCVMLREVFSSWDVELGSP